MKSNFNAALQFVLAHECVFEHGHHGDMAHVIPENVSGDRGGLTKFGIDQRSHPNINIKALTYEGAKYLYQENEWERCCCEDLPAGYDIAVFDTAVNNGCGAAALLLQKALNAAGNQGMVALQEDAFIGPKTIMAAERAKAIGLHWFLELRQQHYHGIVEAHPPQQKFLRGWMDRVADLGRTITDEAEAKGVLAA